MAWHCQALNVGLGKTVVLFDWYLLLQTDLIWIGAGLSRAKN